MLQSCIEFVGKNELLSKCRFAIFVNFTHLKTSAQQKLTPGWDTETQASPAVLPKAKLAADNVRVAECGLRHDVTWTTWLQPLMRRLVAKEKEQWNNLLSKLMNLYVPKRRVCLVGSVFCSRQSWQLVMSWNDFTWTRCDFNLYFGVACSN